MANSKRIAGLLGPVLVVLSVSEALNLRLMMAELGPTAVHVIYLNGTLLFVAGLSIVRVHNYWVAGWPVLVTLMGWFTMVSGLIRMFAPIAGAQLGLDVQRPEQSIIVIYAMLVVLLAMGVVLTFKAFVREGGTHDIHGSS